MVKQLRRQAKSSFYVHLTSLKYVQLEQYSININNPYSQCSHSIIQFAAIKGWEVGVHTTGHLLKTEIIDRHLDSSGMQTLTIPRSPGGQKQQENTQQQHLFTCLQCEAVLKNNRSIGQYKKMNFVPIITIFQQHSHSQLQQRSIVTM